jgi:hypothetical protein
MAFFYYSKGDKSMQRILKWMNVIGILAVLSILMLTPQADAKTIKVGAAINMTGPASTWGQYHARGQQDYFRYVNEVKGGVAGKPIEMILVEDRKSVV